MIDEPRRMARAGLSPAGVRELPTSQPDVSKLIETAFHVARSRLPELDQAWVTLSMRLANSIVSASSNIQRAGALDILLRSMEDELAARVATTTQPDFGFHYQKMLSEIWVGTAYEIARALIQRSREAVQQPDARLFNPSTVKRLLDLHADLERLRIPLEKYEIARDSAIKDPIEFVPMDLPSGPDKKYIYDPKNPHRDHVMPSGISDQGSVVWLAFDAPNQREYWLDRRTLADRFLNLVPDELSANG